MYLGLGLRLGSRFGGSSNPSLAISALSIVENSPQGTAIATVTATNASNPGAISIASQEVANLFQMNVDGATLEVGSNAAALDHETQPTATVTLEFTDDNGTWQRQFTISITDAPAIVIVTGAYLDPDLMLVGEQIGDAFVPGAYADYNGNPVSEDSVDYYVDGAPVAATYVLQTGDSVGQAEVFLSAATADDESYFSGIEGIVDYSYDPGDLEWIVPPGVGASVPDAFVSGNWSVADDATNGDATITITTLPSDNGSALTDLEYRLNGGTAVSLGAATTGAYGISGMPDGTSTNVEIRAINGNGNGAWSDTKSVTTTGVPDAFGSGDWSIADDTTGGDATLTVSALPTANGSAITDLEVKIGAGSWTSLGGTSTGTYALTDAFTDGVATDVLIRAVNGVGNGPDSDTKSVTTTTAGGGITDYTSPQVLIDSTATGSYSGTYIGRTAGQDIIIFVGVLADNGSGGDPNAWTVTLDGVPITPLDYDAVSLIFPCGAVYRVTPSNTGNLVLNVSPDGAARACAAVAFPVSGAGATASVGAHKNESNSTALSEPNGITTTADNNVVLSFCCVKGGDITGLTSTGADAVAAQDVTGSHASNDLTYTYSWQKKATAGSVTHAYTWTGSDSSWGGYIELEEA